MGLPSQYCPVCGGPFNIPDVFDDEAQENIQWLEKYRLIGRIECIGSFCSDDFDTSTNTSDIEGLFISEHASNVFGDGYMFILNCAEYRTFHSDNSGNVLFPIHDACVEIVQHVLFEKNKSNPVPTVQASLTTFYDSLCKQYKRNGAASRQNGYGMNGLEWDHEYYGARTLQGYNDWEAEAGDGDEWYSIDPVTIPELTSSILRLLPTTSTPEPLNLAGLQISAKTSASSEKSYFEKLPTEIIHQIASLLPLLSVFTLRVVSNTLASKLCLDQEFWRQRILSRTLVPYLWDLKMEGFHSKISQDVTSTITDSQWDWKTLSKLLINKDSIVKAEGRYAALPAGFRNRCRIWKIIEEAMSLSLIEP